MDDSDAPLAGEVQKRVQEEAGPRDEEPPQTAGVMAAEAPAGSDLVSDHDTRATPPAQPPSFTSPHVTESHRAGQHVQRGDTPTQSASGPPGVTTGSAADAPTGAPHFVAPSSYLRPLTRDPFARSPSSQSGVGGTRSGAHLAQMSTPIDREQIEGLVSRALS